MEQTGANSEVMAENQQLSDSSHEFFEALEDDVNGMITEGNTEVTQVKVDPTQETQQQAGPEVDWESDSNPYKKRYSDSSREAVKQRDQYKSVEPFVPVLEAMKNDSGLVEHVRDYLSNGGPSKSVQEHLGLDEDFIFDSQEAMTDPKSDSAKLMGAQVDQIVQARVAQMLQNKEKSDFQEKAKTDREIQEQEFKAKRKMSDEEFSNFRERAQKHILTLEDIDYILNRDSQNANVVQSAKNDMRTQMKNVRSIPASASGANSQSQEKDSDSKLFDGILGLDGGLDNMFG